MLSIFRLRCDKTSKMAAPVSRPTLTCRFYEDKFPEQHEAVNTNVVEIGDMGAYVKLLEYNNVGGEIIKLFYFLVRNRKSCKISHLLENKDT